MEALILVQQACSLGRLRNRKSLSENLRARVRFAGFSDRSKEVYKLSKAFPVNLALAIPSIVRLRVNAVHYDAVVVLHENWDPVYSGRVLAEFFSAPSMVLLQSPPLYGSRKRFFNILKALLLWRKLVGNTPIEKSLFEAEAIIRNIGEYYLSKLRYEKVLRKYSIILGVSKAIAVEMGCGWLDKVICLDPGVSLDEEDLKAIKSIRRRVREKENYIVFGGGRLSAEKGFIEALISFKLISKHFPELKLVITGRIAPERLLRIKRVCRKLGIENKVVFTEFVPRDKRLEIIAKARLMLYPSHTDSFSYAVLESLHLGTPIVAYRIPAIEIYYGKCSGVELVEEWDLEALTVKAIDLLDKKVETVEPPKIKSWKEIMSEEVETISKLILKQQI
ncbi:glycosyltransferase [Candidatus Methanodesulfokora washburnensis]|uniref:glycosyltransferase n=1 Tax=Candidatus Methanodesulfokora washburnensis TaxID=2478471 RepID=UPI000F7750FB|nr:glycosyltransferase [Candidatus Methanodesulfokores washburnensis]